MCDRPDALGAHVRLRSLDDVNAALLELGWVEGRIAAIEAETRARIEEVKRHAANQLALEIDGQRITCGERAEQLRAALETWAQRHLRKHLPHSRQSLALAHGTIGLARTPPAVGFDGTDADGVLQRIDARFRFRQRLDEVLATRHGTLTLADVVRLDVDLAKSRIKAAWDSGPERQKALAAFGLNVATGNKYVIQPTCAELLAPNA